VGRSRTQNITDPGKLNVSAQAKDRAQVAIVNWIEGAADYADQPGQSISCRTPRCPEMVAPGSRSNLTFTGDNILQCRQPLQPHRPPGVELVSADTYFRTQTVLEAVR